MVNPGLDDTWAWPVEGGCGGLVLGRRVEGNPSGQKCRGQGRSRCPGGGPRPFLCVHVVEAPPQGTWPRGNVRRQVWPRLEHVRHNAGGKGCERLGHICG